MIPLAKLAGLVAAAAAAARRKESIYRGTWYNIITPRVLRKNSKCVLLLSPSPSSSPVFSFRFFVFTNYIIDIIEHEKLVDIKKYIKEKNSE